MATYASMLANHKGTFKREAKGISISRRRSVIMEARGWSDAKKGHEPRNAGDLYKLKKEKK